MNGDGLQYAVVTPVKDEQDNLDRLAASLESQTVAPLAWVIVDTGSTDDTVAIAERLRERLPFVRTMSIDESVVPSRGGPVVRAFVTGAASLDVEPDVVIKLDADLSFKPDYFERLLTAFAADPGLGITSGICTELRNGKWTPLFGTRSNVWGASRAYRWTCFQEVLPLEERKGWDEIDAIKAQIRGWRVGTLVDVTFRHHRLEGSRDGSSQAIWFGEGVAAHYMGYRFSYLLARSAWRARENPAAVAMIGGFVRAALRREARCSDPEVRAFLRTEQGLWRLPLRLRESMGR